MTHSQNVWWCPTAGAALDVNVVIREGTAGPRGARVRGRNPLRYPRAGPQRGGSPETAAAGPFGPAAHGCRPPSPLERELEPDVQAVQVERRVPQEVALDEIGRRGPEGGRDRQRRRVQG